MISISDSIKKSISNFLKTYGKAEIYQLRYGIPNFFKTKPISTGKVDLSYFFVVGILLVFGLAMHYSASDHTKEQLFYAVLGIGVMFLVSQINLKSIEQVTTIGMGITLVFMLGVLVSPEYHGTKRWFFGLFQPSELCKIVLIMYFAYLMDRYKKKLGQTSTFYVFLVITIFFGGLVLAESHLSGCILFLCIGFSMMWYCGKMPKKHFLLWTGLAAVVFGGAVLMPTKLPVKDYQIERIVIWKKIITGAELTAVEKRENARQVLQSIYGIGSGGLWGKGFDYSGQKLENLQEKANDFIFAVIGEELGFIGSMVLIILFGVLVYKGIKIGIESKSMYGKMICFGISTQMALQVLINISVATSLLPNTGISLPFFSEGGSSMLFTMASMGLMLCVSKENIRAREREKRSLGAENEE